jgi:hypothetical protein
MTTRSKGTVYALIDPRDNKIRYIGKTTQPIHARLAGHLTKPTNPAMRVWINSLDLHGLAPRIEAVSTPTVEALDGEEQRQIRRHAKEGHRLFNAPYYRSHLADLSSPPARSPKAKRGPAHQKTVHQKLARLLFGRLASARAERRAPAWAVAVLVVAGAPVFLALLILRELLSVKAVRRLLLGLMCAWPLWESGFDKAVRELLLPQLPVEECAAFWTEYTAGPLAKLATDLSWPALFASVLMAGAAYSEVAKTTPRPDRNRTADEVVTAAAAALAGAIPPAVEGLTTDPKA